MNPPGYSGSGSGTERGEGTKAPIGREAADERQMAGSDERCRGLIGLWDMHFYWGKWPHQVRKICGVIADAKGDPYAHRGRNLLAQRHQGGRALTRHVLA